jgi:hypothetical protein
MAMLCGARYTAVPLPGHMIHNHAGLGDAARIREKLASDALAQPEKRQDSDDDDYCADNVDDAVHENTLRVGLKDRKSRV